MQELIMQAMICWSLLLTTFMLLPSSSTVGCFPKLSPSIAIVPFVLLGSAQ
jgi:hypothetical protein